MRAKPLSARSASSNGEAYVHHGIMRGIGAMRKLRACLLTASCGNEKASACYSSLYNRPGINGFYYYAQPAAANHLRNNACVPLLYMASAWRQHALARRHHGMSKISA